MITFLSEIYIKFVELLNFGFHNYALSIMASALFIRLMMLPLTRTQIRSMKVMGIVQPYMKWMQDFYKNDRDNLGRRMMAFYSAFKFNPLSGCLPSIVFLIIVIAVWRALLNPYFIDATFLGAKLVYPTVVNAAYLYIKPLIDFDSPAIWWVKLLGSEYGIYLYALPFAALYIATTLLMSTYMRQMTGQQMTQDEDNPTVRVSLMMSKWMPIMFAFFAFIFPVGVMLYFIAQNIIMYLEYRYLPKTLKIEIDDERIEQWLREEDPDLARFIKKQKKEREERAKNRKNNRTKQATVPGKA